MNRGTPLALLLAAALAAGAGCAEQAETKQDEVGTLRASLSSGPTFQDAAKEKVDWKALIDQLSTKNLFRILYTAHSSAKNRGDDGAWALSKDEQAIHAQYMADMKEVYAIYARADGKPLDAKSEARVAALQDKYLKDRQELYELLMKWPELSEDARKSAHLAFEQINDSRAMKLDLAASVP